MSFETIGRAEVLAAYAAGIVSDRVIMLLQVALVARFEIKTLLANTTLEKCLGVIVLDVHRKVSFGREWLGAMFADKGR